MRQDTKNNSNGANRVFSQFGANKKKTVIALCLIGLMVVMWIRVLGKKTPSPAGAAVQSQSATVGISKSNSQFKVAFIQLPKVAGRNDLITRDFFNVQQWQKFIQDREGGKLVGIEEVNVAKGGSEEVARRIAAKLKLEAIALAENPQAFINGKPLTVGGKLLIVEGAEKYECEVVGIEENIVFMRCGQATITLKLKKTIKVSDEFQRFNSQ